MRPIYLDYNATTPVADEVAEAMLPYLKEHFGNPSSSHWYGAQTRKAVERARRQAADFIGANPDEIIFTSGGSESNNYALKGAAEARRHRGKHIVTSAVEHPAVMEVCRFLESEGFEVTYLPVDEYGLVDAGDFEKALKPSTIIVSIMHANNEVGTVQPVAEIARLAKERGIIVHTDAAQSAGKIPVKVEELGVDLLSIAGHKLYAPKGVGALYIRRGTELAKQIHGADHEFNLRAGTENVLEIAGLGAACELAERELDRRAEHTRRMRDRLHNGLIERLPGIKLNGHPDKRLPNTLSLSFPGLEANTLLAELEEIAASAGAACHSESVEISPTLKAMGVPLEYAMGTIRLSTGRNTTAEEIDSAIEKISTAAQRLMGTAEAVPAIAETGEIKLTRFTRGMGCACKIRPQALEQLLRKIPAAADVNVLVGVETSDDAAVYKIDEERALLQTVDFFTPIVDDPYHFGAIAAANSLSDIYAMGGFPLFALNIVGFPTNRLPLSALESILQGALDKAEEAGIPIIGGHTVEDAEPKYGLAVTGIVPLDRIWRNTGLQPGDALVITKPIGTGILATAVKRGLAGAEVVERLIAVMSALNKEAAETAMEFKVSACTDVTGFGLMGHLREMLSDGKASVKIWSGEVPLIEGVEELALTDSIPGGTLDNLDFVSRDVEWGGAVPRHLRLILCDAQTSGGLLIALPGAQARELCAKLKAKGMEAAVIGEALPPGKRPIQVE